MKKECLACKQEREDCADLGYNFWVCSDCLAPLGKKLADEKDRQVLEKVMKELKGEQNEV